MKFTIVLACLMATVAATWYYDPEDPTVDIAFLDENAGHAAIDDSPNFGGVRTPSRWGHGRFARSVHHEDRLHGHSDLKSNHQGPVDHHGSWMKDKWGGSVSRWGHGRFAHRKSSILDEDHHDSWDSDKHHWLPKSSHPHHGQSSSHHWRGKTHEA